jgi:hypothetical protein
MAGWSGRGWQRVRLGFGVFSAIKKRRRETDACVVQQFQAAMQQEQAIAAAIAATLAAAGAEEEPVERRAVLRATGKWRGSTLAGYLRTDDKAINDNCRLSCGRRLSELVALLKGSAIDAADDSNTREWSRGRRVTRKARECVDPPSARYKVAACMYTLGQGGSIKTAADVASVGESTLRRWLEKFADSCTTHVKPVYMPGKPWDAEERAHVQGQFASRRGIPHVSLACDGSHIPFKPKNKRVAGDYRNYKGWHSILTVAFVDSFYRFFTVDVGYPGRAGDNTVLARNRWMEKVTDDPDMWLGVGGVVLGDSGASDGDRIFLNPYHSPTDPERCWFNFCHSSTRFFVEQTFGIWKSRFRFLLTSMRGANHKLMTKLIYASCILHNFCIADIGDACGEIDVAHPAWRPFFEVKKSHLCPTCRIARVPHCVHQAGYRNGAAQAKTARDKPSVMRDELCEKLWREVCEGPDAGGAHAREMCERAAMGGVVRDDAV